MFILTCNNNSTDELCGNPDAFTAQNSKVARTGTWSEPLNSSGILFSIDGL